MLDLSIIARLLDADPTALLVVAAAAPDDAADDAAAAPEDGPRAPVLQPDATEVLGDGGADLLATLGFEAAEAATVRLVAPDGPAAGRPVLVVGLGRAAAVTPATLRRAAGAAVRAAGDVPTLVTALATVPAGDADPAAVLGAVAEGLLLADYRFDTYRTRPKPPRLAAALLVPPADVDAPGVLARARTGVEAACWVRDLVNTAPKDKRPPLLADLVAGGVADDDVTVRVLDEAALADGGYGGILGVGGGSTMKPRLVELRWQPDGAQRHVALVGKGITFDTGGYSLKPTSGQETMRMDMAGAATAAAVVRAAARLRLPVAVSAVLCLAENMISGDAQRVSDVITMRDGTTVEVMNTDAEGRLVLGDGLAHAVELGADTVVDVATLTGAVIVALGDRIGGVMANDDALATELIATGRAVDEPLWQLPLAVAEYGSRVDGTFADLRNVGTPKDPGTVFGALFLARFVPDHVRWAHLDIAGVAWRDAADPLHRKGATGVPVRTLVAWLEGLSRG